MRKIVFVTLLSILTLLPVSAIARVDIGVNISLPPLVFPAPPALVVIPETNVYVCPDVEVDIFFYNGWWWRPWQGHWYHSRHYHSGWARYQGVPVFYRTMPHDWRRYYHERHWKGHPWNHQRVPYHEVERNWRNWKETRHWERHNTWGVQGLRAGKGRLEQHAEQRPHRDASRQLQHHEGKQGHGGDNKHHGKGWD